MPEVGARRRKRGFVCKGDRAESARKTVGSQVLLPFPNTWGGRRRGAGRKRQGVRAEVPHRARSAHRAAEPVHVTRRSRFKPLRSQFVFPTLRGAIGDVNRRHRGKFRIVHFSVQFDHLHLIVEALDRKTLSGGMAGFTVSLARRLNRLAFRRGRLFSDRWHERPLTTPRAVRHAIVYVLANCRKHGEPEVLIDHYSSAPHFRFFKEFHGKTPLEADGNASEARGSPVEPPSTWLLSQGWLRGGSISVYEHPR